jgi:protein TonB
VPSWQGRLLGRLQRFKRYPEEARFRREEGVAHATFTLDRDGRVLAAGIARTSGSASLDAEALALIRRADPLPPPPPEVPGGTVTLTVPLRFSLQ